MVSQNIQITGLEELRVRIKEVRALEPLRSEVLVPAAKLGQAVAKGEAGYPKIAKSISRRTTRYSARVQTKDPIARFVEGGRTAGKKAPPINNARFQAWASEKGIPKSKLFVIARAIGKRGVKGRFFMKKGREAVADALPRLNQNCAKALERIWGAK